MNMLSLLLIAAALLSAPVGSAQPQEIECPLPPYQHPLTASPRAFIMETPLGNDADEVVFRSDDGTETVIYNDPAAKSVLWSDDGEVILILTTQSDPAWDAGVLAYRDGEITEVLDHEALLGLRDEEFRDAVQLFNPAFIPGTHTVLFNTEVLSDAEGIYVEIPLDLWSLDVDTGELTELRPYGDAGQFVIAPDGEHLLLIDLNTIRVTDLQGQNERVLISGSIATGMGHGLLYPEIAWDAEDPTIFRVLLQTTYDPNSGDLYVPFEIWQFDIDAPVLGKPLLLDYFEDEIFIDAMSLSPDGYGIATWDWADPFTVQELLIRVYTVGSDDPLLIDELTDLPGGITPFVRWLDEWHIEYGYHDGNTGEITAWRADLCGEITLVPPASSE